MNYTWMKAKTVETVARTAKVTTALVAYQAALQLAEVVETN